MHVFKSRAILHMLRSNYLVFQNVSEHPEERIVNVRNKMMLRHRVLFQDVFCIYNIKLKKNIEHYYLHETESEMLH